MGRILEFIRYPSHPRTMGILAFLVIVLAIPLTVNIAQRQQEIRQQAALIDDGGGGGGATECALRGFTCDQGVCGTTVNKCLLDSYTNEVGTPPGCFPGRGSSCGIEKHNYRCYESKSQYSCDPPAQSGTSCGSIGGSCVDAETCFEGATGSTPLMCGAGKTCCKISKTPTPATPATQTPATAAPGTTSTTKCGPPYSGPCTPGSEPEYPTCTTSAGSGFSVKVCEANNCWYDQHTDTNKSQSLRDAGCYIVTDTCTPGGGTCQYKSTQECTAANPTKTCATKSLLNCPKPGPCITILTPSAPPSTKPQCTEETTRTACQITQNHCHNTGTTTVTKGKLANGSTDCNQVIVPNQICNTSNITNNCNSGNVCPASGTGQCVTQAPAALTAGNIRLTFTLKLDGLGSLGDRGTGSQKTNPARKSRSISAVLIPSSGLKKGASGTLNPDNLSATVTTTAGNLQNDTYTLLVKAEGFLQRNQGSFTLETGKNNDIGTLSRSLPNGNINNDTTVDASDFELLRACYGKTISGDCAKSDLDDDQQITLFDFNLLLREFGLNDE